jgi:hypothetical protein
MFITNSVLTQTSFSSLQAVQPAIRQNAMPRHNIPKLSTTSGRRSVSMLASNFLLAHPSGHRKRAFYASFYDGR